MISGLPLCELETRGRELVGLSSTRRIGSLWIRICLEELLDKAGRTGKYQLVSGEDVRLICGHSCQDSNTAQSPVTRCPEITLATIWKSMVCGMYDFDNWKFFESWNKYVSAAYAQRRHCYRGKLTGRPVGFVAFDQYKALLQDANGKISGPRTVIAGFGAGVTESLLAVTPFESIKTTL
jgi:hypothetical protein